jgi:RNA polymerase sigma-70 factor (ECF subfamily)
MSETKKNIDSLYRQYYDELRRFLSSKLRNREDADEIAQESFARMLALEDGYHVRHPRGFLYRTALNLTVDAFRTSLPRAGQMDEITMAEDLPSETPGPESIVYGQQRLGQLKKAIAELPPKCRQAFLLHKFENRSYLEIAVEMGISRNMVEKHIIKAVAHCRKSLDAAG